MNKFDEAILIPHAPISYAKLAPQNRKLIKQRYFFRIAKEKIFFIF